MLRKITYSVGADISISVGQEQEYQEEYLLASLSTIRMCQSGHETSNCKHKFLEESDSGISVPGPENN